MLPNYCEFIMKGIVKAISLKGVTRDVIAAQYVALILSEYSSEICPVVNKLIIERWSISGLEYIKEKAWNFIKIKKEEAWQ